MSTYNLPTVIHVSFLQSLHKRTVLVHIARLYSLRSRFVSPVAESDFLLVQRSYHDEVHVVLILGVNGSLCKRFLSELTALERKPLETPALTNLLLEPGKSSACT